MTELYELTVDDAASLIRNGNISPVDLVESILAQIKRLDPILKAWVYLDEDAVIKDAQRKEQEANSGSNLGRLHGVPIGLKDIYHNAPIPTTACSKVYANFVPDHDATTVSKLIQAGAIMLGKTVTTEFACADPSPTINPWNPDHTPGGSSSGSAVSVASLMFPAAIGSQTVGSVLRPASYNGVVGFKPTLGRVSRYGVVPVSWTLDTMGWMTRTVKDSAVLLSVMDGHAPNDPISTTSTVKFDGDVSVITNPKIGVIRDFFVENADSETQQKFLDIVDKFARAGAEVVDIKLPDSFSHAIGDQQLIMSVEGAAFHKPMFDVQSEDYQPNIRAMIQRGLDTDATSYSDALERRLRFVSDMNVIANQVDVLLTPSTPSPALPDITNTGNTMFQGPWTYCGLPTVTVPSGLSDGGMPLGIQLIGQYLNESLLLSVSAWCESVMDVDLNPNL